MTLWHKTLEARFSQFALEQQLLMVCNELNRAQNNLEDEPEYRHSLERAMELIDFMTDQSLGYHRLREILRARDQIAQAYLSKPTSTAKLQDVLIKLEPKAWKMMNGQLSIDNYESVSVKTSTDRL